MKELGKIIKSKDMSSETKIHPLPYIPNDYVQIVSSEES